MEVSMLMARSLSPVQVYLLCEPLINMECGPDIACYQSQNLLWAVNAEVWSISR